MQVSNSSKKFAVDAAGWTGSVIYGHVMTATKHGHHRWNQYTLPSVELRLLEHVGTLSFATFLCGVYQAAKVLMCDTKRGRVELEVQPMQTSLKIHSWAARQPKVWTKHALGLVAE